MLRRAPMLVRAPSAPARPAAACGLLLLRGANPSKVLLNVSSFSSSSSSTTVPAPAAVRSAKSPRLGNEGLAVRVQLDYPSGYGALDGVQEKRERRLASGNRKHIRKYSQKAPVSRFHTRRAKLRQNKAERDPANPASPNYIATAGKASYSADTNDSNNNSSSPESSPLKRTSLFQLHARRGAKFVDFCGWEMPVLYSDLTVLQSHIHTRAVASLFDVSHMCQLRLSGKLRLEFLESLIVGDLHELETDRARLTLFTNKEGGIIDDSVVTRRADHVFFVVNAGCAEKDLVHIRAQLRAFKDLHGSGAADLQLDELNVERGLVALQGPKAEGVLATILGGDDGARARAMPFMSCIDAEWQGQHLIVSRCGYTGEDGYEISVPHSAIDSFVETILAEPVDGSAKRVALAGLGARDSLRLEAGLCLYGNDMDETVSPVEATLLWTVSKSRRQPGSFLGAEHVLAQIKDKSLMRFKRVGFSNSGPPARQGSAIFAKGASADAEPIGKVTSGTFAPMLKHGIGMAHVKPDFTKVGTELELEVRGKRFPATVAKMPFVPSGYKH